MLPSPKPFHLVEDTLSLNKCLGELAAADSIALDLEFDSHSYSYGINLCLIQVATRDTIYIIDPFAPIELDGLYAIFENEHIQKLMHSPGEDLRLLHSLKCYPRNIFDTEVTAKLLNYEQTSLAALLQLKLGLSMNKKQQRSNWLRRPLTTDQIQYAADDVAWLHSLKSIMESEAEAKGLISYVREEQALLTSTIYDIEAKDFFLKSGDLRTLSPHEQHVLNSLFQYRDELAQKLNMPAYKVLDETILRSLSAGTLLPSEVAESKGVYGGYKNARFAGQLTTRLQSIVADADSRGLSKSLPPRKRLTSEEHEARETANRHKEEIFAPIQHVLRQRFGEFAARFIMSNGVVNNILNKSISISQLKPNYKQVLVRDAAKELGIDISSYE